MSTANRQDTELVPIGELARRTNVSARLLRYYEAQGLVDAARSPSGHRRYDPSTEVTVGSIRRLLSAGIPTRTIRELLDCIHDDSRIEPCAVPTLLEHLREHDQRIADLATTRSALKGLIDAASAVPPTRASAHG